MGGTGNSYSPQTMGGGYAPVQVFEKDGQYYQRTNNLYKPRNPADAVRTVLPLPGNTKGGVEPMSFTPINFGGTNSSNEYGPSRFGEAKKYEFGRTYQVPAVQPRRNKKGNSSLEKAAEKLNEQAPPGERLAFINPAEEEVLRSIGGSGISAAGGVPSYKKGDVSPPPPRDVGQETRDTLQAQVDLAPALYRSEATYRPQYANLERGIMLEQLGLDTDLNLLDAYRQIGQAQKDIQADSTARDIQMIGDLGQSLADAQRSADPEAEALRQGIMSEASQGLTEGAGDFGKVADAQRQRLLTDSTAFNPLVARATERMGQGQEYDQLVDETAAMRESNPFDQVVDRAQSMLDEDGYAALRERTESRLDTNPFDRVVGQAESAVTGVNPFDDVANRARARIDSNPYSGLVQQAREDFESGQGLTALEQRDLDQQILESSAGRGMIDQDSTLARRVGDRLSANRAVRDRRRDQYAQALGAEQDYSQRAEAAYGSAINQQEGFRRNALDTFINTIGAQSDYGRGARGEMMDVLDRQQNAGRTALGDFTNALGQQEQSTDRGLNRFTTALGMRSDYGRTADADLATALSGRTGYQSALMGDYERSLANRQSARQQQLANAGTAYQMGNFDPLYALTGRTGTAPSMAQQGFGSAGFALNSSPAIFNPESAYAGALYSQNYQGELDARTASAANRANMFAGVVGGLGSVAGGYLAGR